MNETHPLTEAVVAGKHKAVPELVQQCLAAGETPLEIIEQRLVPGMMTVGERFKRNEVFVPEMLISARAMKEALKILEPMLTASGAKPEYTAVIGTVQGDLHDIGKNLVGIMWRGANIAVVDLGANVPPAKFVEALQQHKPQVLGLSALLTTTMPAMRETIKAIRAAGLTTKIMVGGAPVSPNFAKEIEADGYAPDAATAVDTALGLLKA